MVKLIPITVEGESTDGIVSRFINPGEFFFGDSNCQIHTILGSCIAITLWHPFLTIGGMCHFVLPGTRAAGNEVHGDHGINGRYGDSVMILFAREAAKYGTKLNEYQAKIFGGSKMILNSTMLKDELIGTRNTEVAIKLLAERGIPLLVTHVGETGFRRIAFDVWSGDVWVKHTVLRPVIS